MVTMVMRVPPKMKVLIPLILLIIAPAAAKETGKAALSWQDVRERVMADNPALARDRKSLETARYSYRRSYAPLLPQVSLSGRVNQSDSGNGNTKSYSYGANGSLTLFDGLANVNAVRGSEIEVFIANAQHERTLASVIHEARKNFIGLLWAQEAVTVSENILGRKNENLELVRLKYEAGTEDRGSLLRIEADTLQAGYELEKARRYVHTASCRLAQSMGYDVPDDFAVFAVTGTLQAGAPGAGYNVRKATEKTPEYRIAALSLRKATINGAAAKSGFWPQLSVSAGVSRAGTQWLAADGGWETGLSLSYPLFSGGRDYYGLKIARAAAQSAEISLRETAQTLFASITASLNDLLDAHGGVGVRKKYLEASTEQSRITTEKYINGLATYQEWYTIENDFISAWRALLSAQRDAALSEAALKNIAGETGD